MQSLMSNQQTSSIAAKPVVSSYDEWSPLEEVIVGRVDYSVFPPDDNSVRAVSPDDIVPHLSVHQGTALPKGLIAAATRELNEFIAILKGEGVTVRRPSELNNEKKFQTTHFSSTGLGMSCPRDGFLVIGEEIIETPMAWRSRYFEAFAYRELFRHYFDHGAKWTAAPKPELKDSLYKENFIPLKDEDPIEYVINNSEIVFDAADFIRCGRDIICHLSNVTNLAGIQWLQRHLGDRYRLHIIDTSNWRRPMHLDATFVPLRPGLALINPDEINLATLPSFIKKWDLIAAPQPNQTGGTPFSHLNMCSDWLSINILSLDENRVIVEEKQTSLITKLQDYGMEVIPCPFEHYSPFGGSFHCATLDVRRAGQYDSYFDL